MSEDSTVPQRAARILALLLVPLLAATSGCGGGGDSSATGGLTVASAVVSSGILRYGQSLVVTVTGSQLDQGLVLSSPACKGASTGTAPPYVSGPSTTYLLCTLSGIGPTQVKVLRASDGATLTSISIDVPVPQVTLAVSNGGGTTGTLVITLSPDKAPITTDNFLAYVNSGFYVGTLFHRVAPGFVIQGGGYVAPLNAAPGTLKPTTAPIALETGVGLSNVQWSVAMARTNASVNSATSQFFINLVDNSGALDPSPVNGPGYAVFGSVTGDKSGVTAIVAAPCTNIPLFNPTGECTPTPNMVITSASQTR